MNTYYRGWHYLLRGAVPLLASMKVRGTEHIPRSGPALLVGNHISLCDPPVLMAYVKRHIHFMVKAELFSTFPMSILMPPGKPIKVNRGKVDRNALRQAEAFLKSGEVVAIYAEGTRNRTGAAQEARAGVVFLAQRTGAPMVPAAISGTERVFSPSFPWYRRVQIQLTFGPPFRLEEIADGRDMNRAEQAQAIMARVAALLPPQYRGVYSELEDGAAGTSPPEPREPVSETVASSSPRER
jgi:1-acyl-sn-glycerol-3-phosphate acyltransferase